MADRAGLRARKKVGAPADNALLLQILSAGERYNPHPPLPGIVSYHLSKRYAINLLGLICKFLVVDAQNILGQRLTSSQLHLSQFEEH